MSEPRKASDILLQLEEKIDKLTKIVSVYDINVKLILDRVNKIYAYIEAIPEDNSAPPSPQQETYQISADNIMTEVEDQVGHRRTARVESYIPSPPISPQPAPEITSFNSDKKVPVTQRVTLVDGNGAVKDLFMAEVSILNENNEVLFKTKTNAAGKWQAHLKSGNYTVKLVKTDTATKKKIEAIQEIVVNDSNTTITLPTATIKR
jgi:hypothetical protein